MSIAVDSARIALLGCGTVGGAFARLAGTATTHGQSLQITGALVRDLGRERPHHLPPLTDDPRLLLTSEPDVLVELLGGLEPARALVLDALCRRIPVVTANKSLLAHHGAELREASQRSRTPLLYEAAVIAGVPFLGTFGRRARGAAATSLTGIVNGTTNFILTRLATGTVSLGDALAEAQRRGYAEPDPRNDVDGTDAREKLTVLLQHFAHLAVAPHIIETSGLEAIGQHAAAHAAELGGVIKPVVSAQWAGSSIEAFVGPAFVRHEDPLARVDGVENALALQTASGRLLFQGPGAGPEVTARTVLDDVDEALSGAPAAATPLRAGTVTAPRSGWLVTIEAPRLPSGPDVADLLGSHGLFAYRTTSTHSVAGRETRSFLLWPAHRAALRRALGALSDASGCTTTSLRTLGAAS